MLDPDCYGRQGDKTDQGHANGVHVRPRFDIYRGSLDERFDKKSDESITRAMASSRPDEAPPYQGNARHPDQGVAITRTGQAT